jgi:alkylation response protein AidB-like acyl-CoA dehydrogenase
VKFGGPGVDDFRYNAIVVEEVNLVRAAAEGIVLTLQNDVVLPCLTELTTNEQKARWLPGVVTGDAVLAIAMTEPGAGSDLTGIRTAAVRDGDHYVVGGAKTFMSNGRNGDLFVVATRTSPDEHKGRTLLVIDGYSCLIALMQRVAAASGSRSGAGSNRNRADSRPRAP